MTTYREFCRLRDLHIPGANAPKHTEAAAFFMAATQLAVPKGYKLVQLEATPEIIAGAAVATWPTSAQPGAAYDPPSMKDPQFLTDVVTAAGLLSHGKTDKKLARRISDHAYKVRMAAPGAPAWQVMAGGSAQGHEAADVTKAIYWFDCLYKCAKLLELSDDTAIPSGVVDAVEKLVAARVPNRAQILEQEDSLRYPATMTTALADVLGLPNFRTGPIAHVYRAAGADIRTKCEDEQAFVLDRFLRLALEHGEDWRTAAEADLTAAHSLTEASKAVKS